MEKYRKKVLYTIAKYKKEIETVFEEEKEESYYKGMRKALESCLKRVHSLPLKETNMNTVWIVTKKYTRFNSENIEHICKVFSQKDLAKRYIDLCKNFYKDDAIFEIEHWRVSDNDLE